MSLCLLSIVLSVSEEWEAQLFPPLSLATEGMSLQWNAMRLASGVTQDGQSETTGMKRVDEEEEKW